MPFKEQSIVMQREEFCLLALMPGANIRELCRRSGISPTTGYEWLQRYRGQGVLGLQDRSRRPLTSPLRTDEDIEALVVAVRQAHPAWGGRKIRKVLENDGLTIPPSASTITAILRRHDLLDGPGAGERRDWLRFEHAAPNDLWQMDFKGHVAMGQGRCHPLTVLDDHSRYALEIAACGNEQGITVRARLQQLFQRQGLPRRILADNGPPWGTAGSEQRHTPLSVWLLDLGIELIHGRPYHPQTQGKDERFHRTLKAEVLNVTSLTDLDQAQRTFDAFRHLYNTRRPHEALNMATPQSRYTMSPRSMPHAIRPPQYQTTDQVRKVDATGHFSFKGRRFNAPNAFAGRPLALRATTTDGLFDLCYRNHVISQIDLTHNIIKPVHHVPEHPSTLYQV